MVRQYNNRASEIKEDIKITANSKIWNIFDNVAKPNLNVIIKTDVSGKIKPLRSELDSISSKKIRLNIIRIETGDIKPADVFLAETTKAKILGLNVKILAQSLPKIKATNVEVLTYETLFSLLDGVKDQLRKLIKPERIETITGRLIIKQVIKSSKHGRIAGCFVNSGIIKRNNELRLIRDGIIIWTGKIQSLKRFKQDVKEVRENFECGLLFDYPEIEIGDLIESIEVRYVTSEL